MTQIWLTRYQLLIIGLLVLVSMPVHALDPSVPLSTYHHAIWTAKDGAPDETIIMAQSADGWLWLGGHDGLYRFDGVRFARFVGQPGDQPAARHVTTLTALPDGDVLVGYRSGAIRLVHKGHLLAYPDKLDGTPLGPVSSVVVDHLGRLWATTNSTGLLMLRNGRWQKIGAEMGVKKGKASAAMPDQYGQLWVLVDNDLLVLPAGGNRFHPVISRMGNHTSLMESPDGRLWAKTGDKLVPVPPQHEGPVKPRPAWLAQQTGQDGLFDRDGNYWSLMCPVGVCRLPDVGMHPSQEMRLNSAAADRLDQPWQLSSTILWSVFEDRDGNIWVSSAKGVERFRHNRLTPVALAGSEHYLTLARGMAGQALVRTIPDGALWSLSGQQAVKLPEHFANPQGVIANAADGTLLVATPDAIERRGKNGIERIAYPPGLHADGEPPSVTRLADDGIALWLSVSGRGTFRHDASGWISLAKLGLPTIVSFVSPGKKGAMWLGFNQGPQVVCYDNGSVSSYHFNAGNEVGPLKWLRGGSQLLVGGETGLAILVNGNFRRLSAADPEVLYAISGMVVDQRGDHWLNGYHGVLRIRSSDWQATMNDPAIALKYTLFGVLDGYPGRAATVTRMNTAIAAADDNLWFISSGGLVGLDSKKDYPRAQAPTVHIETVATSERTISAPPTSLSLPPGTNALRLEYTALSYAKPEALRFRHRLDGLDTKWQEAGGRRAVWYNNLEPGDYRFRVTATDDAGQESVAEESLVIRIAPTFTQTRWFLALCVVIGLALAYLLYRLRLRQITAQMQERLAARLAERARIARTLHDSFLQSVHSLTLAVGSTLHALPPDSSARRKLENTLLLAERVMEDGRDEVSRLRAFAASSSELARALGMLGEGLAESNVVKFILQSKGDDIRLPESTCSEIYNIGREALINAFNHAGASTIEVHLNCTATTLTLQISDNGVGIAPEVAQRGHRPGHWGLSGMRERAVALGAVLEITDLPPGGTEILLTLVLAPRCSWLARWRGPV